MDKFRRHIIESINEALPQDSPVTGKEIYWRAHDRFVYEKATGKRWPPTPRQVFWRGFAAAAFLIAILWALI
jgi:hypothetical protein